MTEQQIDFKQQRDFGEVLNATFAFFRINIGPLGKALAMYLFPFLILQGIARVYFNTDYSKLINVFFSRGINDFFIQYISSAFALILTSFLSTFMANLTVYSYIKAYNEKAKGKPASIEIWQVMRRSFFPVLFASLVVYVMFLAGLMFCVIPGIYLWVSLSFVIIIMMYEGKPFGKSFKRSFALAHYQWWSVFLLLFVMYIVVYIVSLVFSIPQGIIESVYDMNKLNPDSEEAVIKYVMIVITMLSTLAYGFINCVLYIALSFKYFSIVEKKESPGLLKDIEELERSVR